MYSSRCWPCCACAALSLPLGVAVTRVRWLEQPVLGLAGVIQTIPSLALLAAMVPLLASMRLQSIGFLPAFIGLTLYGVLPISAQYRHRDRRGRPRAAGGGARGRHDPPPAVVACRTAAGAAGHHRRSADRDGLDRRHRDPVDPDRGDQPRELHLQRLADKELRRGAGGLRGVRRPRHGARRAGPDGGSRLAHAAADAWSGWRPQSP